MARFTLEERIRSLAHSAQAGEVAAQELHSDELKSLTRHQLASLIAELAKGEASIRKLRKRLVLQP
jgi:hypothetical protein